MPRPTTRRVVVTGLGIISPVGIGIDESWSNITAGKSGITRITRFDAVGYPSQIAGEVKGFEASRYLPVKEARRFDTFIHYGLAAGIDAIKDAAKEAVAHAREDAEETVSKAIEKATNAKKAKNVIGD